MLFSTNDVYKLKKKRRKTDFCKETLKKIFITLENNPKSSHIYEIVK